MEERTYTKKEVIELLSYYESHIRCHIFQYIDKDDLMSAEEWAENNMKESEKINILIDNISEDFSDKPNCTLDMEEYDCIEENNGKCLKYGKCEWQQ